MNNRDWLYTLPPRDLARWFESEHVEPNDDLSPEKNVKTASVDSNDVKVSTMPLKMPSEIKWQYMDGGEHVQELTNDSREKLEADVRKILHSAYMYAWMHGYENRRGCSFEKLHREFYNLLDRQEAITEREWEAEQSYLNAGYKEQIAKLTAERDMWRERCGRMLDAAHELARIAEVDG